jgi:hypothetical protein
MGGGYPLPEGMTGGPGFGGISCTGIPVEEADEGGIGAPFRKLGNSLGAEHLVAWGLPRNVRRRSARGRSGLSGV